MDLKAVDAGLLQSRYRLTKQRAAVLRALGDGRHLTAETILERVRTELPGVSLGTIYRTLDILRGIGLVQVFSFGGRCGALRSGARETSPSAVHAVSPARQRSSRIDRADRRRNRGAQRVQRRRLRTDDRRALQRLRAGRGGIAGIERFEYERRPQLQFGGKLRVGKDAK